MLPGIMGMMAAATQSSNRFAEYLGGDSSLDNDSSYSFTSFPLGAAHTTRRIFVTFHWGYSAGVHRTISDVTIAGVAATIHIQQGHTGGATGFGTGIASALVPTGTSGTIVVASGSTLTSMRIGAIRTIEMIRTTPFDSDSQQSLGATADLSVSINIPEFGLAIGSHNNSSGATNTVVWSGVTEAYDDAGASAAFSYNLDLETNRVISIDTNPEGDAGNALVALSWN